MYKQFDNVILFAEKTSIGGSECWNIHANGYMNWNGVDELTDDNIEVDPDEMPIEWTEKEIVEELEKIAALFLHPVSALADSAKRVVILVNGNEAKTLTPAMVRADHLLYSKRKNNE